mgnify:CR=1 FL=1
MVITKPLITVWAPIRLKDVGTTVLADFKFQRNVLHTSSFNGF